MTARELRLVHDRIFPGNVQEGTGICATPPCIHRAPTNKVTKGRSTVLCRILWSLSPCQCPCECVENIDHAQIILRRTSIPVAEMSYSLHAAVVKENVDATMLHDCLHFNDATVYSLLDTVGTS